MKSGASSGTPRSSSAPRHAERGQRGHWRSRVVHIPIRRNELTEFYDIQATKTSGGGLPDVPGDELGGAAQLSSRDMQQIQSSAVGGGGSAGNHAKRSVEYAPAIQVHSLEAAIGEEIGLHFKTGKEATRGWGGRGGKSEILKLLRVPRGSVRGKMRMARRRRRSAALQNCDGSRERSRLGCAQGAAVTEIKNDPVGFAE